MNTKKFFAWLVLAFCILSIPVAISLKFNSKPDTVSGANDSDGMESFNFKRFQDRILVLELSGMIYDNEGNGSLFAQEGGARGFKKRIRKALKDKHIKGLIIKMNTPGGTVATSQELTSYVKELKNKDVPVVVCMSDVAASGGYYIASAADKIIAEPGTLTGSIGVIMNLMNFQGIEQKIGVRPETIKSGKFKDLGSPNREMTPEDRAILQSIIMDSYDQFIKAVAQGRKMDLDTVRKIADGRVYSGLQAQKLGLVDELGGYDLALQVAQKLSKDRFGHKKDLPVDDKSEKSVLETIMQASVTKLDIGALGQGFIPESMRLGLCKQPLWLWQ
jgi:protease-4